LGFYGLRPSEVAKLKVSDFDFDLRILILRNTKGNRRKEELRHVQLLRIGYTLVKDQQEVAQCLTKPCS